MVLEPAWEERLSLTEGGEGNSGITGGTEGFFLLEGGTRGGGRDMGTGSPSNALYTKYMAWDRVIQISNKSQLPIINLAVIHISSSCVESVAFRSRNTISTVCNSFQDCTYNLNTDINKSKKWVKKLLNLLLEPTCARKS